MASLGSVLAGCEDQFEPRAYLGPVTTGPAYTAPPVYVPGSPTTPPAPTTGLVELPATTSTTCGPSTALPLGATQAVSLGVADGIVVIAGGAGNTLSPQAGGCPAEDAALEPLIVDEIGPLAAVDARGVSLVAGATAISAVSLAGDRVTCELAAARSVARLPGTDRGYAITGNNALFALDWSSSACAVSEIALAESLGTLALAASASSGPWLATIEQDTTAGTTTPIVARARRFDEASGSFDELSPRLGAQPGTLCGIDALALSDDGDRVAIVDGACGRVVVFRASDGELLAGVSLRAKSVAPVPNERAFIAVASASGNATFTRIDAE